MHPAGRKVLKPGMKYHNLASKVVIKLLQFLKAKLLLAVKVGFNFSRHFKSVEAFNHHENKETDLYDIIGGILCFTSVRKGKKLFVNGEMRSYTFWSER